MLPFPHKPLQIPSTLLPPTHELSNMPNVMDDKDFSGKLPLLAF
jgi:hypothetical protein